MQTTLQTQLQLQPTGEAPYPGPLSLTISGELMQSYAASFPVTAQHPLGVAQDSNGDPMVFSIGDDDELYVIVRDPACPTGWSQYALSEAIEPGFRAQVFAVSQSLSGDIRLAVAGTTSTNSDSSRFYITGPLSNAADSGIWADFAGTWIERPSDLQGITVEKILIGDDNGKGLPPMIIAAVRQPDDTVVHYFVNGDPDDATWSWKPYPLPQTVTKLLDIAIGNHSLGPGTYALYEVGSDTVLMYTTIPDEYHITSNRQLTAPPGARALATIPDPSHASYSTLFVAGDGIFVFDSHNQGKDATAATVVGGDAIPGIDELVVHQDPSTIAIWVKDQHANLYYLSGSNSADPGWTTPLVLRTGVGQIAAQRNQPRQTNELVFAGTNPVLGYVRQDPATTLWRETDIPLQDTGTVQTFDCYTTTLCFTDANGNPLIGVPVTLNASEWTYATVNGALHTLDDDTSDPTTVQTDSCGNVTIINKAGTISTPVFWVASAVFSERIIVDPATKVTHGLSQIQSGADLKNATLQDGTPLLTDAYDEQTLDYAAYSISQLTAGMAQLPPDGSQRSASSAKQAQAARPSVGHYVGHHAARSAASPDRLWGMMLAGGPRLFEGDAVAGELLPALGVSGVRATQGVMTLDVVGAVEAVAGDIIQTLFHGVEEVFGFFVQLTEEVFEFFVKIGTTLFKITLKAIGQVLSIINWIFEELFGIDLLKLMKWLGFLFDWGDIVTTHQVLANVADRTLDLFQAEAGQAEAAVRRFFTHLKAQIAGIPPLPASVTSTNVRAVSDDPEGGTSTASNQAMLLASNSPGGNFSTYQVLHGGILDGVDTDSGTGSGPIVTFLDEVLIPALADVGRLAGDIITDLARDFENGTLTIDQVMAQLRSDVIPDLLQLVEDLVVGFLELAQSVLATFQDIVDKPIHIPFLSALYKLVAGGDEMSLLDGMALLAAIPATIFYKIAAGQAPFANGTYGLLSSDYQTVFGTLAPAQARALATARKRTAAAAATDADGHADAEEGYSTAQTVYSQLGGAAYTLTSWVSGGLDAAEALSDGEIKFASKLQLACSLVGVGASFPIELDKVQRDLDYGVWGLDIFSLIIELIAFLSPRSATVELEAVVVGPYQILEAILDLVLFSVSFGFEMSESDNDGWGWDVEKYIQNLLGVLSTGLSGVSKIDQDPVSKAAEQVAAGGLEIVGGILNLTRITKSIEDDLVHQNY